MNYTGLGAFSIIIVIQSSIVRKTIIVCLTGEFISQSRRMANEIIKLVLVMILVTIIESQKLPKCHLSEMEKCFDKLHQLKNEHEDPSILLTNHDGLNKICSVIRQDFVACLLAYIKKCGTPLHKELSKVLSDAVLDHMTLICDPSSDFRNNVIEKSPCIHEKVLSQQWFQKECNNPFFTTVAWGEMQAHSEEPHENSVFDYVADSGCCAYRRWEQCAMPHLREQCQVDSDNLLMNVISKLLGGVPNFLCYQSSFEPGSETCQSLPSLDEQLAVVNMTYADQQTFSFFSLLKMFLVRDQSG